MGVHFQTGWQAISSLLSSSPPQRFAGTSPNTRIDEMLRRDAAKECEMPEKPNGEVPSWNEIRNFCNARNGILPARKLDTGLLITRKALRRDVSPDEIQDSQMFRKRGDDITSEGVQGILNRIKKNEL